MAYNVALAYKGSEGITGFPEANIWGGGGIREKKGNRSGLSAPFLVGGGEGRMPLVLGRKRKKR